jgi:hypothetical protein
MFFKTNAMDAEWLDRCRDKGWTRDTKLVHCPQFEPLKKKLLSLGGTAACIWDEPDFDALMARGKPFRGLDAIMRTGEPRGCHRNSSRLWEQEGRGNHRAARGLFRVHPDG